MFHVKHAAPRLLCASMRWAGFMPNALSAAIRSFGWGVEHLRDYSREVEQSSDFYNHPTRDRGGRSSLGRED